MLIRLPFGKEEVEFEVPDENILAILKPSGLAPKVNLTSLTINALSRPIGLPPLSDLASKGAKVLIVIDDYTRKTPTRALLPHIIRELRKGGIRESDITILMALGTHRPPSEKEVEYKIGKEIWDRCAVLFHNWKDDTQMIKLGKVDGKVIVKVNKAVKEADLILGLGMIIPHRVSGYSGGGKIIQPGISGPEITGYTHWMSAKFPSEEILGVFDNPVKRCIDLIAEEAGLKFLVNLVLDGRGNVIDVFAGDFREVHRKGSFLAKRVYGVKVPGKADIVIADCPPPTDIDMWQAAKSLYAASLAVKPGGTIVLLAACPEGISKEHPEVEEMGYRPYDEIKCLLEKGEVTDLIAASHMVHVGEIIRRKARCILISKGIGRGLAEHVGFEYASNIEEALELAIKRHGSRAKIIVLREAPSLIPIVKA